ncbi:MAG: hypothetical protein J3Q66DRAFT_375081 [Benniella sp.]|nr:MAG: hypothetical protein J3Q66DRAFT_375081 [Benniella sp.]
MPSTVQVHLMVKRRNVHHNSDCTFCASAVLTPCQRIATSQSPLAQHNGYKLHKQNEFIRNYGRYILPMMFMFMVKYGAETEELVVPPLLELRHANVPDDGQEHLRFLSSTLLKEVGFLQY